MMANIVLWFKDILGNVTILDFIDIGILTFLIYKVLKLTSQSRANQVLKGILVLVIVAQISSWLNLIALAWISGYILNAGVIVLAILFQPEIRRAFEKIGAGKLISINQPNQNEAEAVNVTEEIIRAVQRMSGQLTGALIVIQNREPLSDIAESGTQIYAKVSAPLIENIFTPSTPLHDGAIIINGNVILAAGCFLPISSNPYLTQEVGTRHRAALGLSEKTDSIVIVVSEETGIVSSAIGGKLTKYLDSNNLRTILEEILIEGPKKVTLLERIYKRLHHEKNK